MGSRWTFISKESQSQAGTPSVPPPIGIDQELQAVHLGPNRFGLGPTHAETMLLSLLGIYSIRWVS